MKYLDIRPAVVHQPYFLPWLGFFNKIAHSSAYVALDDVQYRTRYYHNRAQIKNMQGQRSWIVLPVRPTHRCEFRDVQVSSEEAINRISKTIAFSYARSKYFPEYWPLIHDAILQAYPNLVEINLSTIKLMLMLLGMDSVQICRSSNTSASETATNRLINACSLAQCNAIIMGDGGSWEYHDLAQITSAGILLERQSYLPAHPVYPQPNPPFIARLSIIDCLFNVGPQQTRRLVEDPWRPSWHGNAY